MKFFGRSGPESMTTQPAETAPSQSPESNPIENMFSVADSMEIYSGQVSRMPEGADKKQLLCASIRGLGQTYFFGKQGQLNEMVARLEQASYPNDQELVAAAAKALYDFSQSQITPRELEHNIRHRFRDEGRESLNEILSYDIKGDELLLHLEPSYTLDTGDKFSLIRSGFIELGRRLKQDGKFKEINTIRAVSWLVAKYPRLFDMASFIHDGELDEAQKKKYGVSMDKRPIGMVHISKDAFLEKLGNYLKR
jgi:hypothetical protein